MRSAYGELEEERRKEGGECKEKGMSGGKAGGAAKPLASIKNLSRDCQAWDRTALRDGEDRRRRKGPGGGPATR